MAASGRSRRAWGWHRLTDDWAARVVAAAGVRPGELVFDIGAGQGALTACVVALTDGRNPAIQSNLAPLGVGLAVAAIGMSYGANAGYAINPARDLGPRLFAFFAGWGKVALPGSYSNAAGFAFSGYFWIPIIGPLIGGVLGVVVYDLFIGDVLHARLKLTQDTEGPIPESRLAEDVSGDVAAAEVPETGRPQRADSDGGSPRDQRTDF